MLHNSCCIPVVESFEWVLDTGRYVKCRPRNSNASKLSHAEAHYRHHKVLVKALLIYFVRKIKIPVLLFVAMSGYIYIYIYIISEAH